MILPPATNRKFWQSVPQDVKTHILYGIEGYLDYSWPPITASQFLDFEKTGNRERMASVHLQKRALLSRLVLAECMEHNGRFLKDILNGLLSLSEEFFWGISAHFNVGNSVPELPEEVKNLAIDPYVTETASLIAWTKFLLAEELSADGNMLMPYFDGELRRRLLDPFMQYDSFFWTGLAKTGRRAKLNDWTPWIVSNVLQVTLLNEIDYERRNALIERCFSIMDQYLHDMPADGGCDEGVAYWSKATGSLVEFIWLLDRSSGGKCRFYDDPKVHNMVTFIRLMHISGRFYYNFSDAPCAIVVPPEILWIYGEGTEDWSLSAFAVGITKIEPVFYNYQFLHEFLRALPYIDCMRNSDLPFVGERDVYLPDSQIVTARFDRNSPRGFFLGCKGGHNGEAHNHNDVGSYVIYHDGFPVIVDLGVGSYTKKTFSPRRYELENCQSNWHNLPTINGVGQKTGREARAKNFQYRKNERMVGIAMDLTETYPQEAGLVSFTRQILLERGQERSVTIHDIFNSNRDVNIISESIIVCGDVEIQPSRIVITDKDTVTQILFDSNQLQPIVEEFSTDNLILQRWGRKISRISLRMLCYTRQYALTYKIQ
ncbi:MAG: heparinase II/III family protein [Clostridia bacterium]|nr:heparinase II/III family protein [Clostridia bacterium]